MSNIKAAITKLDKIKQDLGCPVNDYTAQIIWIIQEVLLSLQGPEDDKTPTHREIIAKEARRRLEMIEDRLASLEKHAMDKADQTLRKFDLFQKQINTLKDFSHDHKSQEGITFPYNPDYDTSSAPKYKVHSGTEIELMGKLNKTNPEPSSVSECKHNGQRVTSEITSCAVCGEKISQHDMTADTQHECQDDCDQPKPTTTPCPKCGGTPCFCQFNGQTVMSGNPEPSVEKCETITIKRDFYDKMCAIISDVATSDNISISRKVAEEWVENVNGCLKIKDELYEELKLALSKEEK
jgi:uncharacterized lipoprotein NlpE involved in copper resistance